MKYIISIFILLSVYVVFAFGLTCQEENIFGNTKSFQCPKITDSHDEIYCCGSERLRYCCSQGYDYSDVLVYRIGATISVLIVVVAIIVTCLCCKCCPLHQYRMRRNGIILTPGYQQPLATPYQTVQTYPAATVAYPPATVAYPPPQTNTAYSPPTNTAYPQTNAAYAQPPPAGPHNQPSYPSANVQPGYTNQASYPTAPPPATNPYIAPPPYSGYPPAN